MDERDPWVGWAIQLGKLISHYILTLQTYFMFNSPYRIEVIHLQVVSKRLARPAGHVSLVANK